MACCRPPQFLKGLSWKVLAGALTLVCTGTDRRRAFSVAVALMTLHVRGQRHSVSAHVLSQTWTAVHVFQRDGGLRSAACRERARWLEAGL